MEEHSEPVPVDFPDVFDDWIGGASIATRSVAIHAKPGLYADYQKLERELKIAEDMTKGETSIGDTGVDDVLEKMKALYDEWMASKSTWIVQAISEDQVKAIRETVPFPEPPPPVADDADKAVKSAHDKAIEVHNADFTKANNEANLLILVDAVTRIEFADGRTVDGVTADQLRKMRSTLGSRQMLSLVQAATLAALEEPEIPSPFSQRSSKTDRT